MPPSRILPDDSSGFPSMPSLPTLRAGGDVNAIGRIDHYDLLRKLGGGGFGVVYLALDTASGIEVALKTLHPLLKHNAEEMDLLREKFALVSRLSHTNIATALVLHPVRDVNIWDETARMEMRLSPGDSVMVMRYAPGVTLSKWRRQFPDGIVPLGQAIDIARQIASALDYAHGERIVHRDIKPANIMVETLGSLTGLQDGQDAPGVASVEPGSPVHPEDPVRPVSKLRVRLLDFGLAAEIRSSMSRVSTEQGDTSGTRPYMAPEQWIGRKQDGRADQYALACVLYEMLSGDPPFAGAFETGDPAIMERAVLGHSPAPIPNLPEGATAALTRALAKAPEDRFPSCAAFVEAVACGIDSPTPKHTKPEPQGGKSTEYTNKGTRFPRNRRVLPWIVAGAAVILSFAIGNCRARHVTETQIRAARDNAERRVEESRTVTSMAEETRKAAENRATSLGNQLQEQRKARAKAEAALLVAEDKARAQEDALRKAEEAREKAEKDKAAAKKAQEEAERKATAADTERKTALRAKEAAEEARRKAVAEAEEARRKAAEADSARKAANAAEEARKMAAAETAIREAASSTKLSASQPRSTPRPNGVYTETVNGIPWTFAITNGVATLPQNAIPKTTSGDVVIPAVLGGAPVRTIRCGALSQCSRVTSFTIPEGVYTVENAFTFSSDLKSVSLPASVTKLGINPCYGCPKLVSFSVPPSSTTLSTRDGVLFDKTGKKLLAYPEAKGPSYIVPPSVTEIGFSAFGNNYSLQSITLPSGLKNIENSAFCGCKKLTKVIIPASVEKIDALAFGFCNSLLDIQFLGNAPIIDDYVFSKTPATVTVPRNATGWGSTIPGKENGQKVTRRTW